MKCAQNFIAHISLSMKGEWSKEATIKDQFFIFTNKPIAKSTLYFLFSCEKVVLKTNRLPLHIQFNNHIS